MLNLNNYNEYILNMILEQVGGDMDFQIFPKLSKLLREIDHPIAKKILELAKPDSLNKKRKITYLDYELFTNKKGKEDVRFTFSQSNKVYQIFKSSGVNNETMPYMLHSNEDGDIKIKNKISRVSGKIGKVITSLFGKEFDPSGKPGEDIESFTNAIKSKLIVDFSNFKIVEGDDIVKYYNVSNYVDYATGTVLGGSCMRYNKCENYIQFYNVNKKYVKLVIMFGEGEGQEDKIAGRALLWTLTKLDGEPTDRLFMDRIYTTNDIEIDMFKEFAEKNGWLHKYGQNMVMDEKITDTKTGESSKMDLGISDIVDHDEYPYMDTMKILDRDKNTLANNTNFSNGDDKIKLESTSGKYDKDGEDDDTEYVEYYDEYFDIDDLRWCSLGEDYRKYEDAKWIEWEEAWATEEWVSEYATYSNREEEYIDIDEAIHLIYYDEWVSQEYADNDMVYSSLANGGDGDYYDESDAHYSKYHGTWIYEDYAIQVNTNYNDDDFVDAREIGDNTYFEYTFENEDGEEETEYYDNGLENHFIKAVFKIKPTDKDGKFKWDDSYEDENNIIILDKIQDKDKYFKWKGHYFINKLKTEVTGQLKIW